LDEIHAAVLRVKLKGLDSDNEKRQKISAIYRQQIKNPQIILPQVADEMSHVWHLFVVRTNKRDQLQQYLTNQQIQTLIHYPLAPHKQAAYKEWNNLNLPITEQIHNQVLSLPISPVLNNNEVFNVVEVINKFQ